MVHVELSSVQFNARSFVCTRLVQTRGFSFFLFVILAQSIVQFRSAHQLIQNETPDFLRTPTRSKSSHSYGTDRMMKSERLSKQQDQYRMLLHNELKGFTSQNEKSPSTERQKRKQTFAGEFNHTISQSRDLESRKNMIKGDITVDRNTSSTEGIEEELGHVITKFTTQMDRNSKRIKMGGNAKKRKNKIMGRPTRVIYGIMTYDSISERKRRGLIRATFLKYFKNHLNRTIVSDEEYNKKRDWICSLNDLDRGLLSEPKKCRMAYAFVQGANPNGTSMLLTFNDTYPISLPPPKVETVSDLKDHSDTVFLNIQENGKFGKSPTWFRYAIDVLERHGLMEDWDYIFKADTDNLLYTPWFFRYMDSRLPKKKKQLVYGGQPLDYKKCGGDNHDDCKDMIGPYFMQGGCYFLSTELARFISDETSFDHQAVKLPHEDMTTGNFVYSHPTPDKIKIIKIKKTGDIIRKHPVKEDRKFNFRWGLMLRKEQARLVTNTTFTDDGMG